MNAVNIVSVSTKASITCYVVTAKLKTEGPVTTLSFVSAVRDGQRAFDRTSLPSEAKDEQLELDSHAARCVCLN